MAGRQAAFFPDTAGGSPRLRRKRFLCRDNLRSDLWRKKRFRFFPSSSFEARASASCSGEWKKIAVRYCVPTSGPCRLTCVGVVILPEKLSTGCCKVSWPDRNPLRPLQRGPGGVGADLFIGWIGRLAADVAYAGAIDSWNCAGRPASTPPEASCRKCRFCP